jgi:molybdopterin synthase catalytic subunit
MRVRVLFFGQLREIVGVREESAELAGAATVKDVFEHYARKFPELGKFAGKVAASVNQEYAQWNARVADGDEVGFLPPVSGGAGRDCEGHEARDEVRLTREALRVDAATAGIREPGDGALVVFDGFVRDNFKGRRTTYLEYEAYEPMALAQMREIAAQMREKFRVNRTVMVHRLGRLELGETSIVIAVTAAHRAAAFDACRYAIDTLKRTVPIWKKEFFADGSVWAEGETPGPTEKGL